MNSPPRKTYTEKTNKPQNKPHPTIIRPITISTDLRFLPAVTLGLALGLVGFRETDDSTCTSVKQKGSKIQQCDKAD